MSKKRRKFYFNNMKSEKMDNDIERDIDLEDAQVESVDDVAEEPEAAEVEEVKSELEELQEKNQQLTEQLEKEKKEYLFLMADFDNFRKRTLKEKAELIKNGAESAFKSLLPIVDDFERGIQAMMESNDLDSVKEGMTLIYNKFIKYLEQNGVKPMETPAGTDFDSDSHEAVTMFPVDDESKKGKIIDTVQKGYMIHDKVLRHAKVVVGQ